MTSDIQTIDPPLSELADPIVSANVYCAGRIDQVIHHAIKPFWQDFKQRDDSGLAYLWLMRYRRCGEHLKVRIHGPEDHVTAARRLLAESVEAFLAGLPPAERPEDDYPFPVSPIDAEDEATTDYPDRSFLWTRYGRSGVSLGSEPFLLDDEYAARLTRCLGSGCELVLEALEPDESGGVPHRIRHNTLTKILIGGLAALDWSARERTDYLLFHRDWLVRFPLIKGDGTPEKARQIVEHFDQRWHAMRTALEGVEQIARRQWEEGDGPVSAPDAAFRRDLDDLLRYIRPFAENRDYHIDPFATNPNFAPIFKAFHGVANQLGLGMLEEALAYHLLGRISGSETDQRFLEVPFEPAL